MTGGFHTKVTNTFHSIPVKPLFLQVSVDECSEGIIRVAQQTLSLDPRQQGTLEWEMSAGINTDLDHNCTGKEALEIYCTVYSTVHP